MDTSSTSSVQSITRVLDIIEILSAHPFGLSLTDIAEKTQLHTSTAHRLLATLLARGYAFKSETSGKYCLSLRMFELGSQVVNSCGVLSVTRPLLDDLFTTVGGTTIHLVLWENSSVTYIYKNDAPTMLNSMQSHVGLHVPMYCTGVGKSILALLPKERVQSIWEQSEIKRFTPTTITTLDKMYAELQIIREQGYALDNEEHESGIGCVAAAIRSSSGNPIAAVSISSLIQRIKDQEAELSKMVMDVANNASRQLGYIS